MSLSSLTGTPLQVLIYWLSQATLGLQGQGQIVPSSKRDQKWPSKPTAFTTVLHRKTFAISLPEENAVSEQVLREPSVGRSLLSDHISGDTHPPSVASCLRSPSTFPDFFPPQVGPSPPPGPPSMAWSLLHMTQDLTANVSSSKRPLLTTHLIWIPVCFQGHHPVPAFLGLSTIHNHLIPLLTYLLYVSVRRQGLCVPIPGYSLGQHRPGA